MSKSSLMIGKQTQGGLSLLMILVIIDCFHLITFSMLHYLLVYQQTD